uniref:flagellin n=1 Tax=Shigella sp. FC1967 TaxID=1898041 RepID=UPI000AFFCA71
VKVLSEDSTLNLQIGAHDKEQISVDLKKTDATTLGIDKLDLSAKSQVGSKATEVEVTIGTAPNTTKEMQQFDTKALDDKITNGTIKSYDIYYAKGADGKDDKSKLIVQTVDAKGVEGYFDASVTAGAAGAKAKIDVTTTAVAGLDMLAEKPLKALDDALAQVDSLRSAMGAVQNRLDSTITNLGNTVNNLTASRSRILDADYATEVSNMSKNPNFTTSGYFSIGTS